MKELPESLRPYEKCRKYGAESLSDAELLAVFIRSGYKDMSALEVAEKLLLASGGTLAGLYRMDYGSFTGIRGIGHVKAIELECLKVICARIRKSTYGENPAFTGPKTVSAYYMEEFRQLRSEVLRVLYLNTKMHLLRQVDISKGSINSSMVPTREILVTGLRENAVCMILLHNHPSGDPEPSDADISATIAVENAGNLCGIRLADHIVLGDGRFVSMRERGLLNGSSGKY